MGGQEGSRRRCGASSRLPVALRGPDFKLGGAPDPKLGFGNNGYLKATQFSALESNSGQQTYDLPAAIDPADDTEALGPVRKVFRSPRRRDLAVGPHGVAPRIDRHLPG